MGQAVWWTLAAVAVTGAIALPVERVELPRGLVRQPPALARAVWMAARKHRLDPLALAAVCEFETAGFWWPGYYQAGRPTRSKAHRFGLIQWSLATGADVGASPEQSAIQQCYAAAAWISKRWIEAGISPDAAGTTDHYLAVFSPAGLGKPDSKVLYAAGTDAYVANHGMDVDGDGDITVGDVRTKFRGFMAARSLWQPAEVDALGFWRGALVTAAAAAATRANT